MTRLDEARRQQALLRVLWRLDPDLSIVPDVQEGPGRAGRGLGAYRANAAAHARRALADIFPVLRALLGEEAFDMMALAYWRAEPPVQGDLSHAGDRMAAFIARDEQLASEPYLADVARLECALHRAQMADDSPASPLGLGLLAEHDPASLVLVPAAAISLIESTWPVQRIHAAHAADAPEAAFAGVRAALAAGDGDAVLVWRDGFRPRAGRLEAASLLFWRAVVSGLSLADALDRAGPDFDFQDWLVQALMKHWLAEVRQTISTDDPET